MALQQALLLRGSRDFADLDAYRRFVDEVLVKLAQLGDHTRGWPPHSWALDPSCPVRYYQRPRVCEDYVAPNIHGPLFI